MPVRDFPASAGGALDAFRYELLRWNRQINLVSRRDPERRIADLVRQCDVACMVLQWHLSDRDEDLASGPLLYCDLGSGAGLPGFVWHARLSRDVPRLRSWLVEPREKRAWFLERVARFLGPSAYGVLNGRWGEVAAPSSGAEATALISLKALMLTDPDVLAGLANLGGLGATVPPRVVITRFRPEGAAWSAGLVGELAVPPQGEAVDSWRSEGRDVLTVAAGDHEPASLLVSRYTSRNS